MPENSAVPNAAFDLLVEQQSQSFTEAKAFNDWMPPEGQYTMVLKGIEKGVFKSQKDEKDYIRCSPVFIVLCPTDESVHNKECSPFYSTMQPGILKTLVTQLVGAPLATTVGLKEAIALLDSTIGTAYIVEVTKNAKGYVGLTIIDKANVNVATEAPAETEAPVADAPPAKDPA